MPLTEEEKRMYGSNISDVVDADTLKTKVDSLKLSKVFGIMFLFLLLTVGLTAGFSALFWNVLGLEQVGSVIYIHNQSALNTLLIIGIIPLIGIIVFSVMAGAFTAKGSTKASWASQHSVIFPAIGFSICMSYLLAFAILGIPWQILLLALSCTMVVFGVLSLIGLITKDRTNVALMMVLSILSGAILLIAFTFLLTFWIPGFAMSPLYWVVEILIFLFFMIMTIVDVARIKKIAASGYMSSNLELFCAFELYVDFIVLFLRILYFLLLIFGSRR